MKSGEFIRKHTPDSDPPEGRGIAVFAILLIWLILSAAVVAGGLIMRLCDKQEVQDETFITR